MQDKMREVTHMKLTRWHCAQCEKTYDRKPQVCMTEGHTLRASEAMMWSFKCTKCKHRVMHEHSSCLIVCPKCGVGGRIWEAASIYHLKDDGDDGGVGGLVPKALARGEQQVNSLRYNR